jgi:hypothetical protein
MTSPSEAELEEMAGTLAASGQYRIQRRIKPRLPVTAPESARKTSGI